jgi:hypothetical protein
MSPIPETSLPEEQSEQPLEEQIPAEIEAEQPAEEAAPETVETEEIEQPEEVEAEELDASEDVPTAPVEAVAEETPPKPPSKFQLLLRKIGIWTLIAVVVFAVCGLLAYFQIYRPVQQNVATLEGQLSDLQAELSVSEDALAESEDDLADAEAMLEVADARVALYKTLNGITAAQAALEQKNGQDALKALKEAQTALSDMLPVVEAETPEVAEQMETRLKAAISSLSGDFKTTKADLETLTALLMQQDKIFLGE